MDFVCGTDLTNKAQVQEVFTYITKFTPSVVIMSPLCTTMGGWSRLNRHSNPERFAFERRRAEQIADVCAAVAMLQLKGNRHFCIENPRGSYIFKLAKYQQVYDTGHVVSVSFPQCACGLTSPEGEPAQKWTTLWTSSEMLARPFRALQCRHNSHRVLEGSVGGMNRTKLAQVWPAMMCAMIIDAVI